MSAQNPDKTSDPRSSLGLRSGTFPEGSTMLKYSGHTMVPRCMKYDKLLGRPSVIILCDLPMCRSTIEIELSLTTLWVLSGLKSHANYLLLVEGEAVLDLFALEYGPSHQLDLPLRPAQDPFLVKKVRWVGVPFHTQNLFFTGATRASPWKAGGSADTGTDITRGI